MFDMYKTPRSLFRRQEWRWRYIAANGNIIANSSEGYVNYADCVRSVQIMRESADARVFCMGQPT